MLSIWLLISPTIMKCGPPDADRPGCSAGRLRAEGVFQSSIAIRASWRRDGAPRLDRQGLGAHKREAIGDVGEGELANPDEKSPPALVVIPCWSAGFQPASSRREEKSGLEAGAPGDGGRSMTDADGDTPHLRPDLSYGQY